MTRFQQPLDQVNHLRNMSRRTGHDVGSLASERIKVLPKSVDIFRSIFINADACFLRLGNDSILDVRYVHDVSDVVTLELQVPAKNVCVNGGSKVSDMPVVPNGGSAIIETHFAFTHGAKLFEATRQCVVESKHL